MQTLQGVPGVFFPANAVMKDLRMPSVTIQKKPVQGIINMQLDPKNWNELTTLSITTQRKKPDLINEILSEYFKAYPLSPN